MKDIIIISEIKIINLNTKNFVRKKNDFYKKKIKKNSQKLKKLNKFYNIYFFYFPKFIAVFFFLTMG